MKKIILPIAIILIMTFAGFAQAFEWHSANQVTVLWDAVTKLSDGSDIPATSTIKYKIYLRDESGTIAENQEVDTISALITFVNEGKYHVGISAVRYENTTEIAESDVTWSDVSGMPDPFGFLFYLKPEVPAGLRMQ